MAGKSAGLKLEGSLLRAGERVCVAVSGGADSVALLVGLVERARELGVQVSAAHVNHGLRGDEADGDEAFVRELCERLGVALKVFRVDTPGRLAGPKAGLETEGLEKAARELRYEALRGVMASGEADVVATAHTMDDQAETVVMKLLRGAWTEGLGGISAVVEGAGFTVQGSGGGAHVRESGDGAPAFVAGGGKQILRSAQDDNVSRGKQILPLRQAQGQDDTVSKGRIVRPMLGARRAEVEAFLRERAQGWREDSSNEDLALTRNRVRRELMPMLRTFNPGVDEALANVALLARDEQAFWDAELGRMLPQLLLPGKPVRGGGRAVGTGVEEAAVALEVERLRGLAPALRRRVVRAAARSVGARLSFEETAKVLALAGFGGYDGITGRVGSRLELRGGLRVERSARELRFSAVKPGT